MLQTQRAEIRLALPSKGRLASETLNLLSRAGLEVYNPNPRQLKATIPAMPELTVIFQRAGDIVVSVRDGSVDFGITGWDMVAERGYGADTILPMHRALGFGHCSLNLIVPEEMEEVRTVADLRAWTERQGRALRIATKFPNLTRHFLQQHNITNFKLIAAEGALEIAPTIGYADIISDLVSTGATLRENRLRTLEDGLILTSQAALIANRERLRNNPTVLAMAKKLLEFIVAHLRASENVAIFANIRGASPEQIAHKMLSQPTLGGLQGPTISPVITKRGENWFAVNIVVPKNSLSRAIAELRAIGGSGVVVIPVTYIFEEEPLEYRQMLDALKLEK